MEKQRQKQVIQLASDEVLQLFLYFLPQWFQDAQFEDQAEIKRE